VASGQLDIVRLFVEAGGDINFGDHEGKSAIMLAAEYGYSDIVHYLALAGADLDSKTSSGITVEMLALKNRDVKTAKFLLQLKHVQMASTLASRSECQNAQYQKKFKQSKF